MYQDIVNYVAACDVCQCNKYDNTADLGLLRLLRVPQKVWSEFPWTLWKVYLMHMICRLHGLSQSIVSDKDVVFISTFWQELFKLLKVQINTSSTYHPQSDGQTEVVIQFEVVYGHAPSLHMPCLLGNSVVEVVDRILAAREIVLHHLKYNLHKAQNRMEQQADQHRSDRQYSARDWVYVKLQL
ncbi:uncharacterized protein [Coffea arabica]|uniref:Integrase zinc-binding domain-containing protein n=1 Tax=Coffea arabica TaxID=13443 RepID=A0ABM4WPA2_COFAR